MRIIMSLLSLIVPLLVTAFAQEPQNSVLDELRQNCSAGECISVDYEFTSKMSDVKVVGEGTVLVQGNAYHMTGNGLEIYCDGSSTWMIDKSACEVVIETADSKEAGYLANPLILLMNLEKSSSAYRVAGNTITIELSDGTVLVIDIKDLETVEKRRPEAFRPPVEFGSDWIVTDLR